MDFTKEDLENYTDLQFIESIFNYVFLDNKIKDNDLLKKRIERVKTNFKNQDAIKINMPDFKFFYEDVTDTWDSEVLYLSGKVYEISICDINNSQLENRYKMIPIDFVSEYVYVDEFKNDDLINYFSDEDNGLGIDYVSSLQRINQTNHISFLFDINTQFKPYKYNTLDSYNELVKEIVDTYLNYFSKKLFTIETLVKAK